MMVQEGNVYHVNFHSRKRVASPEEVHRVDSLTRGAAASRFWFAIQDQADEGRIKRGKDYARAGHVVHLDIRAGSVAATVAGSQIDPFNVQVILPYRSNDDITEISSILARTTNGLSRARGGLLSEQLLDLLIAEDTTDIDFRCDCPDHSTACKHAVATVDRLCEKIDADTSIIFQLRGIDLEHLESMVMNESMVISKEALKPGSDLFFQGRPLPDLPNPSVAAAIDDSDMDLLHKAMRQISYTNVDQLRAVSDLEDLYDYLIRR